MRLTHALVALCFLGQLSFAQGIQWIGIDARISNIMATSQRDDELCWAASAQMILNFYGNSSTQSAIVQRVHHDQENRPGSDRDITSSLDGMRIAGGKHLRAVADEGFPSLSVLVNELSHARPIYITFATGPRSGHAVIITAVAVEQTQYGITIRSLVLRDPFPTPQNIATRGRVQLNDFNLTSFSQTVRKHWIITPTDPDEEVSGDLPDPPQRREHSGSAQSCSDLFDSCIARAETQEVCEDKWQEGCMESCQKDYGNSYTACRNNFCRPSTGSNVEWASMCRTQVRGTTSVCRNKQSSCERRSQ
jgi:hypothetical protein